MIQDFLKAIAADPESDCPKLIYADWLEEQGNSSHADFLRWITRHCNWYKDHGWYIYTTPQSMNTLAQIHRFRSWEWFSEGGSGKANSLWNARIACLLLLANCIDDCVCTNTILLQNLHEPRRHHPSKARGNCGIFSAYPPRTPRHFRKPRK